MFRMNRSVFQSVNQISAFLFFKHSTSFSSVRFFSLCPQCLTDAAEKPLDLPPASGEKTYSKKIQNIVSEIASLNLLEVSELNELLKETLNIQDTPVMMAGSMPLAEAKTEDDDEKPVIQEKVMFTVKLTKFDAGKKVALIKLIKTVVEGMNLVQAKKFVESAPQNVLIDISKEEAEELKKKLEGVGGTVEII